MGRSYSKLRPEVVDDLTRLTGYTAQELHQKYSEFLTFHPSGRLTSYLKSFIDYLFSEETYLLS